MHWILHTSIHIKRLQVQVSIPFITKDIAIIRIFGNGGGHLEFPHEKMDEKNGNSFFMQSTHSTTDMEESGQNNLLTVIY